MLLPDKGALANRRAAIATAARKAIIAVAVLVAGWLDGRSYCRASSRLGVPLVRWDPSVFVSSISFHIPASTSPSVPINPYVCPSISLNLSTLLSLTFSLFLARCLLLFFSVSLSIAALRCISLYCSLLCLQASKQWLLSSLGASTWRCFLRLTDAAQSSSLLPHLLQTVARKPRKSEPEDAHLPSRLLLQHMFDDG